MSREIFISYRRDDAAGEVGPLAYALRTRFGDDSVFLDTSDIPVGGEWPAVLREDCQLGRGCRLRDRAGVDPDAGRVGQNVGIDDSDDWVRNELELALDSSALVVPVLVRHAPMPPRHALPKEIASLADRQAVAIRDDSWSNDVERVRRPAPGTRSAAARSRGRRRHCRRSTAHRTHRPHPTTSARSPSASRAPDIPHRDETADAIRELAASLDLDDCAAGSPVPVRRPSASARRLPLGVHVRSSAGTRRDRRVLSAVGERCWPTVRRSSAIAPPSWCAPPPRWSPTSRTSCDAWRRPTANAYVRRMAQRALTAARR